MIGDPPVNNNIVQDNLERQCRCPPPLCHCRRDQVRGQVLFQLQEASEKDLHNDRDHFIPRGKILEIFSRQHVGELLNIVLPPVQGASTLPYENLVDYISPAEACPCSTERCTGARLIFASLILTAKENQLLNFANQDEVLCDSTLNKDTTRLEALLRSWDWTQREYDAFQRLQWPWRSPYLTRRFSLGDIELPDKVTLPWIEMTDPSAQSGGQVVRTKGHFSDILKIRIHQDHFDADQNGKAFALKIFQKTLNPRLVSLRFEKEFEGNNRLGNAPENIVPLFAAFKYRGEHALVFPWAEGGSLKSIWKYQFSGTENFPDWCNSNWVQEQSLGLANALVWIHCSDEHTVGQNGHAAQLHGDIKPDNILAFPTSENGNFRYTLKFADFGSSRPVGDDGTVKTEGLDDPGTYRAPEKDLKMASVSLKWDTWSLGCVLLDFITWYLSGFEKVEEFAKKRQAELHASGAFGNKGGVIDEAFFRIRWRPPIPGLQPKWKAQVKRSVTSHIKELRELGNCDTGLRNALNAIETRILLAEETKRAASTDIRDMLSPRETTNGVVIS